MTYISEPEAIGEALLEIVGPEGIIPLEMQWAYTVDGLSPAIVVQPASVEEVSKVIGLASRWGLGVIPWGGGTMMGLGNRPHRYDIALDMRRLNQVIEHEPADLTITVEAGTTVKELQARLAAYGQRVALDPPWPDRATVGGTLATGIAGPARWRLGHPRDTIIGIKVVMPDGRIAKAGGKVVKNVAGYDLCKLYIGSLGTLAVIVEATFKLVPTPRSQRVVACSLPTFKQACGLAKELQWRLLPIDSLWMEWDGGPCVLVCRLAGSPGAVSRSLEELDALARQYSGAEAQPLERWPEVVSSPPVAERLVLRVSVLPSRLVACLEALTALEPELMVALPLAGVAYARWPAEASTPNILQNAFQAVATYDGILVIHQCPFKYKEGRDVFGWRPPAQPMMKEIKRRWDPKGTLSPGRFVAHL